LVSAVSPGLLAIRPSAHRRGGNTSAATSDRRNGWDRGGGGTVGGSGGGPSGGGGQTGGNGGTSASGGTGTGATGTGATAGTGATGATGGAGGSGGGTTCVGHCNKTTPTAAGCYCDTACFSSGDCCDDYSTVCTGAGGGARGRNGVGGGGPVPRRHSRAPAPVRGLQCDSGGRVAQRCSTSAAGNRRRRRQVEPTGEPAARGARARWWHLVRPAKPAALRCDWWHGATGGTGGVGGSGGTGGVTGSCANAEQCSNPATMVCDPDSLTCGAGQCTATQACPTGQTCLGQVQNPVVGACYTSCTPYATSACSHRRNWWHRGAANRGTKTEGAAPSATLRLRCRSPPYARHLRCRLANSVEVAALRRRSHRPSGAPRSCSLPVS
jgi:hypothetical protein